jgi:hypothetical protein
MKHWINDVEKQRDYFIKESAKWQKEYFAMKTERDNLMELLKMHHQATAEIKIEKKEVAQ